MGLKAKLAAGAIVFWVVANYSHVLTNSLSSAKEAIATVELTRIDAALQRHKVMNIADAGTYGDDSGVYPADQDAFMEFLMKAFETPGRDELKDQWGMALRYERCKSEDEEGYEIRSAGQDKQFETFDDLWLRRNDKNEGNEVEMNRDLQAICASMEQTIKQVVKMYKERMEKLKGFTGDIDKANEFLTAGMLTAAGDVLAQNYAASQGYPDDIGAFIASQLSLSLGGPFQDAWGNAYQCTSTGEGCTIASAGADGQFGTADDIVLEHSGGTGSVDRDLDSLWSQVEAELAAAESTSEGETESSEAATTESTEAKSATSSAESTTEEPPPPAPAKSSQSAASTEGAPEAPAETVSYTSSAAAPAAPPPAVPSATASASAQSAARSMASSRRAAKLTASQAKKASSWLFMAKALEKRGKADKAAKYYRKVRRTFPNTSLAAEAEGRLATLER